MDELTFLFVYGLIVIFLYLLPAIIVYNKDRKNKLAITWATILLGWTGIGWVIALIWALTTERDG
jgi:hypothetical protein